WRLVVEEVMRLLREERGKGGLHVIPPSLQQSLTARLDRLGPAREVAQVGSVIGRGFSYGLLRSLTGMADAALQAALEQLAEADICSSMAPRQTATIASSTRLFRMRPMKIFSRAGGRCCIGASPRFARPLP